MSHPQLKNLWAGPTQKKNKQLVSLRALLAPWAIAPAPPLLVSVV